MSFLIYLLVSGSTFVLILLVIMINKEEFNHWKLTLNNNHYEKEKGNS